MPRASLPRLKDVATEAKVSISAASRILRGQGERYSKDTRERVMTAAQKLGWRQNLLVSGMQTGQTRTIGVMIPPFDSFWVGVLDGIHTTLAKSDFLPITVWPGGWRELGAFEAQKEEGFELIGRLLDRRVEGLILWPTYAVAYREHFRDLRSQAIPVGVIDYTYATDALTDVVEADDRKGAIAVADYLLKKGHRRIACLSTREIESQTWAVRRREAFEARIDRRKYAECRSWRLNSAGDNGREVATEILTSKFSPTAVFCVSDHEAKFIYAAAENLGISIPGDLSVIGFNNLDFSQMLQPTLTTMELDSELMGRQVAKLVIQRLDNRNQDLAVVKVEAKLVERGSVGPPRPNS